MSSSSRFDLESLMPDGHLSDEKEVVGEPPFIVVGIDYGTTHSGAAWAKSGAVDQVEVISQWSSQTTGGTDSDKVPSDICYDADGRPLKWGFGLTSADKPLRWVKLLLSPLSLENMSSSGEAIVDDTRIQIKQLKKTVLQVISDYLRFLWNHILERLRIRLTAAVFDNMVLKVVLTVPAIWDHNAHEQMRNAAERAGITKYRPCGKTEVSLIAEPAAAALATYFDAGLKLNPTVKLGSSFVVCDAGGGTVDLISYTIKSFEPFRLTECIGATGDLCGAVYIDRAFLNHVKTFHKNIGSLPPDAERRFMEKEWETGVKRNFDGTAGPWHIELPQNQYKKSTALKSVFKKEQSNLLQMEGDHLQQIFAEVVPKITDLLRDQVQGVVKKTGSSPKVIIVVGGFGGNRYLLQQTERQFSPEIIIQQPTRAWSAVCRGAVHRGVQGGDQIVCNHISKYWYGISFQTKWVDEKGFHIDDKCWDHQRQCWAASNQVEWYLRKEEDVEQLEPVEYSWEALYKTERELQRKDYTIYYSDHDSPGSRLKPHIQKLCKIKPDMSSFKLDDFPIYTNSIGEKYRRVSCVLSMAVTVSSIDWSVYCQEKKLEKTVEYHDINSVAQVPT